MVSRTNDEPQLTMLVVHEKHQHSALYLALVPASLDAAEIDAAFRELGIDAARVFEVGNWKTTASNVGVAFLPFPDSN
jgi:hypothetical protein